MERQYLKSWQIVNHSCRAVVRANHEISLDEYPKGFKLQQAYREAGILGWETIEE